MDPIQRISELFHNCNHEAFLSASLDEMMSGRYSVAFTSFDFFSIEPFAEYFHRWPENKCKLYKSVDELDSTENGIFIVAIEDRRVIALKRVLGGNVSYDTVTYRYGEWECHHKIYRNGDTVKPISIELLMKAPDGRPQTFVSASEYGMKVGHYDWVESGVEIIELSAVMPQLGEVPELAPYAEYSVEFSDDSTVSRICRGSGGDLVYDAQSESLSFDEKLVEARAYLHDKMMSDLAGLQLDKSISCLLLEYSDQGPMPPTIALIQPHEVDRWKDEHPLIWLNAPDCELFSEESLDGIKLHGERDSLLYSLNADLQAMEDWDEMTSLIFNFYLELCKSLAKSIEENRPLNIVEDFFVTAREFSACNEAEFLRELWPEERLEPLEEALSEYQKADAERTRAFIEELERGE